MADDKRTYQSSLPVAVNGLKPVLPVTPAPGKKDGNMQSRRIKGNSGGSRSFSRDLVLRLIERIQEK
jgi:hypothetical protein